MLSYPGDTPPSELSLAGDLHQAIAGHRKPIKKSWELVASAGE
jgi:hypothetical protein